ncbi:MAG: HEPN domain-containing protein [Stellaceae bacterium]
MTPEAARFLEKARECIADAMLYQAIVPRIAGREAYLAAFHAAEALLYERTGKIAKTHRGLRAQFTRIAKDEPRIDQTLSEFLGRAYELKSLADYGTGTEAKISAVTATAAVAMANRFVDCISGLLA